MSVKTKTTKVKTENPDKVVTAAEAAALQQARDALVRARAERTDDFDVRDAALSFVFDQWKGAATAVQVMRACPQAQHLDVAMAIIEIEARRDDLAEEILAKMPETSWGAELRAAVLIEQVLPILTAQDADAWDALQAIIGALQTRRAELALAPFMAPAKAKAPPLSTTLLRFISVIGDILLGAGSSDAERIIAALHIVGEAEAAAAAR